MEKTDKISSPEGKQNQDSACEVRQSDGKSPLGASVLGVHIN